MPRTGWSPSTVPYGADQTAYLVVDRFNSGSVYRETEIERSDLETMISDFMTGQFNDPVRVVAFNTLEHWADDVSEDVAQGIQTRSDIAGDPVPEHLRDFVETYAGPTRQLTLRLVLGGECNRSPNFRRQKAPQNSRASQLNRRSEKFPSPKRNVRFLVNVVHDNDPSDGEFS